MYRILDETLGVNIGVTQPPVLRVVRGRLQSEIDKVVTHLKTSAYDTGNNNVFVKALNIMGTKIDDVIFEAYDRYRGKVHRVAKACGFTSSLWSGTLANDSVLYGDDYYEAIIVKESEIDLLSFEEQWKDLKCLRVVRHPISSVSPPSFLYKNDFEEKGFVVLELDLVLMCMQYRQWLKAQVDNEHESIMTMGQFIYQVVYPSCIQSHMDYVMLNRFMCHFEGVVPAKFVSTAPIHQLNYADVLDRYLLNRITVITNKALRFDGIASHLETITKGHLLSLIKNPNVTYTRQNEWVLNIAIIPYLHFLLAVEAESPGDPNRLDKNYIRRRLRAFNTSRGLHSFVRRDVAKLISHEIETHISTYL